MSSLPKTCSSRGRSDILLTLQNASPGTYSSGNISSLLSSERRDVHDTDAKLELAELAVCTWTDGDEGLFLSFAGLGDVKLMAGLGEVRLTEVPC